MAETQELRVAILVVSDTAAADPSTDRSLETLKAVFDQDGGNPWSIIERKIVPDDIMDIRRSIIHWTDRAQPISLILTTGGTGFAVRDNTPEAVQSLLHKHAPGLIHAMLATSLAITPFAMMARPVAGVRNSSLIITLPGSPKGATENLQAILKLLPHAISQVSGKDSRSLHAGGVQALQRQAGLTSSPFTTATQPQSHHHHAHCGSHNHATPTPHTLQSNDPSLGPMARYRTSPYPLFPVPDALSAIFSHSPAPRVVHLPTDDTSSLLGYILAEDIASPCDVPAFHASIVDGYALVAPSPSSSTSSSSPPSTAGTFPVVSISHAAATSSSSLPTLQPGELTRITTGAPLPQGANAVVMVEDTQLASTDPITNDESTVTVLTPSIRPYENVRLPASDIAQSTTILTRGEPITPVGGELGLLAACGIRSIAIYAKPTLGVLSTGDEIVPHTRDSALRLGEVRDSNRPSLLAAITAAGFPAVDLGIASDDADVLEKTLRDALANVDVLVTTGGVSMGEKDLLKGIVERRLGGSVRFGRVAMKPGKPTTFMTVPWGEGEKVIFALPGNPASAVVTFHLLVLPAVQVMSGVERRRAGLRRVRVRLEEEVRRDKGRVEYVRVSVRWGSGDSGGGEGEETLWAMTTGGQRSSRVGSLRGGNGLIVVQNGEGTLAKGESVECLLMGPIEGMGN